MAECTQCFLLVHARNVIEHFALFLIYQNAPNTHKEAVHSDPYRCICIFIAPIYPEKFLGIGYFS